MIPCDALRYAADLMEPGRLEVQTDKNERLSDLVEVREICRRVHTEIDSILKAAKRQGEVIPDAGQVARARHGGHDE
jgi:deoxycytidylate deaminase